ALAVGRVVEGDGAIIGHVGVTNDRAGMRWLRGRWGRLRRLWRWLLRWASGRRWLRGFSRRRFGSRRRLRYMGWRGRGFVARRGLSRPIRSRWRGGGRSL